MRYIMDNSFLTGCELVDTQHGQLFDAINALLGACENGADRNGLKESLDFLSDYTIKHFFDEEQILKKHGFTDLDHHHQYHEAFKKVVRDLSHEFILKGVSGGLIKEVENKIGTWLIEHIKGQDFRWTKELKEKAPELFTGKRTAAAPAAGANAALSTASAAPVPAGPATTPASALAGKSKKHSVSILTKMTILTSAVLFVTVLIVAVLSLYNMRTLAMQTAITVTENELAGDVLIFKRMIDENFGTLKLDGGKLVDQNGVSLENRYDVVDRIAKDLEIEAGIFVRTGDGFSRVATTLTDTSGRRLSGVSMAAGNAALKPLLAGKPYTGEHIAVGTPFIGSYAPLYLVPGDTNSPVIGAFFVGVEMSQVYKIIDARASRLVLIIAAAAVVLLLISITLNFGALKFLIINPVKKIIVVLQQVGDGDISQQIRLPPGDEIGEIAGHFDRTLESLKRLVMIIQNEAEAVDDTGKHLSVNMGKTARAVDEINGGVQEVQKQIAVQARSVGATNTAMGQITENINKLTGQIETQTASVSQSSQAVEEMLTNIDSVTRISRVNAENVQRLSDAAEIGRTGLEAVAKDINEVAKESEGLLEINSVLATIASQTNLLSMNAAIEAAHAGEAGRGFAVVAGEIRKLAESSGEQSKTISAVLKKIKDSMAKISSATGEVLNNFETISTDVKTVANQEDQILNAMEEQSAGSKQILEVIEKLKGITLTVKTSSEEMEQRSGEIIDIGKNLEKITVEIGNGMNDMAKRTEEVNETVNQVNSISGKSSGNIEILKEAISHFIILDKHYLWDDSLSIGIKKIDDQHRQLFDAVNNLIDAVEQGRGKDELKKALDFLTNYTVTHFADEEEIQKQYGYPDFENHHRIHESFKKMAVALAKEFLEAGTNEALVKEVKRKFGDWLVTHIKGQDSKLGVFISQKTSRKNNP
ncbi:hypothetical protein AGMMS49928_11240 [Spirochaetia bacterium]|nr:hypothetical protein AGMMS49928_11240 [Spirochaetia bacterium]